MDITANSAMQYKEVYTDQYRAAFVVSGFLAIALKQTMQKVHAYADRIGSSIGLRYQGDVRVRAKHLKRVTNSPSIRHFALVWHVNLQQLVRFEVGCPRVENIRPNEVMD
ncbi:hypothetical protein V6N12_059523 [Hibiscus sabdariffa]|uniref:Uncharacterized protein n=1 Tax=Hibiscus sabdariffa TaxID=183260 RepID=A0ABR2EVB8_9ROSI